MKDTTYIVAPAQGLWTIRFRGRVSDRFEDRDDAILTALIRAQAARRQGRRRQVLVEEHGRERVLWEDAGPPMTAVGRRPVH